MRKTYSSFHRLRSSAVAGPWLIAVGLAILIAAAWIPVLPVLTPMAVLTLGATYATLSHLRASSAAAPLLMLHAATYATLYALFVGAMLQLGVTTTSVLVSALDLAASWPFIAISGQQIVRAIGRG